jgi:ribosome-associated toxin RatA of RatAB toxin-antitoxin module
MKSIVASVAFLFSEEAPPVDFGEIDLTGVEAAQLVEREVVVRVERDRSAHDAAAAIVAVVDIAARPETIWAIMLDCDRAPDFVPNLKSCSVLDASADGAYDIREHVIDYALILPEVRSVFRSDYTPYEEIRVRKAGGDLRHLEGLWRLEPIDGNAGTRVSYQARLAIGAPIPRAMIRSTARKDVRKVLRSLRGEAESDEKAR